MINKQLSKISAITSSHTTIRKIGNSKGIIFSNKMLSELQLEEGSEVEIVLAGDIIKVVPIAKRRAINTDLSSWDAQFKAAIKNGQAAEKDLFEGVANEFDDVEW